MAEQQKRKHKRVAVIMTRLSLEDIEGKTHIKTIGDINNISLGGIALETVGHYEIGMTFKSSFTLPNGQEFKNLIGKVMWLSKSPDKNYVGIRFTRFDLFDRIKLAGCLLEIMNSYYVPEKMMILRKIVEFTKKANDASVLDFRQRAIIVDAGLKIDFDKVYDTFLKVDAAGGRIFRIGEFAKIVTSFSKAIELLPVDYDPGVVKPELLRSREEIELFENIRNNEAKYFSAISVQGYEEAFMILLGLCQNLDGVTEKYKLERSKASKEENNNRLSLMYFSNVMYSRIADIYNIMEH